MSNIILLSFNSRPEFTLFVEPSAGDPEFLIAEIKLPGVVRHTDIRPLFDALKGLKRN